MTLLPLCLMGVCYVSFAGWNPCHIYPATHMGLTTATWFDPQGTNVSGEINMPLDQFEKLVEKMLASKVPHTLGL